MKLMVILLLVAASHAIDIKGSRTKKKTQEDKLEDREFSDENSSVEKRDPAISTVSPAITPGVEYADSKESQQDKSPTHQTFTTPAPYVSKVSDFLTGQGTYQSAIANNLYAPVSAYQPRLAPASYEVSAPVPSNLAYAELSVSLQPSPNGLPYAQKPFLRKNFQEVLLQQPLPYSQSLGPIAPYFPQYQEAPLNQFQLRVFPGPQPLYQGPVQIPQPVQVAQPVQTRIEYSQPQATPQLDQRELKPQPTAKIEEKQAAQNIDQPQGAVSFAKFSQVQSTPPPQQEQITYQPQPAQVPYQQQLQTKQLQPQPQYQIEQQPLIQQQQLQYQPQQTLQYQPQQQLQYQPQQQVQYQPQPQLQYQPQQQLQYQPQQQQQYQLQQAQLQQQQIRPQPLQQYHLLPQYQQQVQQPLYQQGRQLQQQSQQQLQFPQPQLSQPQAPRQGNQISYLRPGPVFLQSQFPHNEGSGYKRNVALPTFPPVQYFGKYAQSIFRDYQH